MVFILVYLTCVHVEPAQPTPSTAPPLPCETHPAQRPSIILPVDDRWFLELKKASIGDFRVLCFLGNFGTFFNTSGLRRRAEFSKGEEPPCGQTLGRLLVGKKPETSLAESAVRIEPFCVRNRRSHKREDCAIRAKTRRNEPGGVTLNRNPAVPTREQKTSSARLTAPREER